MKHKSLNHLTITARLTADATSSNKDIYARFPVAHNVGSTPLFLNAVFFSNQGKRYAREIPWNKLVKGNLLTLDGSLRPNPYTDADGNTHNRIDFVVSRISEPELVAEDAPEAEDAEAEEPAAEQEA